MRDAQTTGGYPRIANVISNDLDFLAQNKPGDSIKFKRKID
jgi:antagonist of KipI